MRGKTAKLIHKYARVTGAKTDNAAKEQWCDTPRPKRAKLREQMMKAINPKKEQE